MSWSTTPPHGLMGTSTKSLELFNQHMPRTNNNVEGWQSRMKKVITKPHLNIFAWMREEAVPKAKLQVWSYGSATKTPYEGEGEKDTDSFWPLQRRWHILQWIPRSNQAPYWTSGLELRLGHRDAVWRRRRRGHRLFLTASSTLLDFN